MAFTFRKKHEMKEAQPVAVAAAVEQQEQLGLSEKIAQYDYLEHLLEDLIVEQETLSRNFYAKQREAEANGDSVALASGEMVARDEMTITDISFPDFKQLSDLAKRVVPNGLPNAHRRFVLKACSPEMVAIEDLEEMIKLYRYRMGAAEQDILDHRPKTVLEATAKLRFMSSLMLDGLDIKHDYFFYLVEECAMIIEKIERRRIA
ncbi:hypothetical protein ACTTAI_14945 [Rhodobacter capsulatus]|uniref:hypothetical protein n=1 Tax=Rhodobacter capsulatus TaxID=1061 RepID=UPI004025DAC9